MADPAPSPWPQVATWLEAARSAGAEAPDAMALATASADGIPSVRVVILRGIDNGLVFFTDRESAKAADLEANPWAAAVLRWPVPVHRQLRVIGRATPVTDAAADGYWAGRRPGMRYVLAASHQSEVGDRSAVERRVAELRRSHPDESTLPRPRRWGGYCLVGTTVEFWEEAADGIHDRVRYRVAEGEWVVDRLEP